MASIATLLVALATTSQGPSVAGGDAVILQSVVTSSAVSRVDVAEVEQFIEDRIHDAWGVEVSQTPPIDDTGRHFFVTLEWRRPRAVFVQLSERDVVHVDREVEIADPKSGRAILWLAIRSSIERALAAMPEAPSVHEMLHRMAEEASAEAEIAATATVADEADTTPEIAASPAPAPAPTTVRPVDDGDPIDPKLYSTFDALWARRPPPKEGTWSGSVLLRGGFDGGVAIGPMVQAHYVLGRWLTVGGELGWYHVSVADDLSIDHLPLTAMASMQPDLDIPLEVGARGTIDIEVATNQDGGRPAARLLVGPFARSALPFYVGDGDLASFVAELRIDFALVRGSYEAASATYVDPVVGVAAAVGVEYRWR